MAAFSSQETVTMRQFKDPIHDYIPLSSDICKVVDTKHFQRLRDIKQLGTSYYVWPGASHNRFEHCLGVAHLATLMVTHLQRAQPELGITERDVRCVILAGLCHDLGHGPWSHVWDSLFIPVALKGKKWCHEDASEMMLDDMIKQYPDLGIPPEDATFIKALIAGAKKRCPDEKGFLFEIVANKRNGLDVDKFDYIQRDSIAVGERGNLSLSRLITSARVIENQICYDIKDSNQIYELCWTRFSFHKRIYNHKTAKAIEYMIVDAILAAEPYLSIAKQIEVPSRYLYLTDHIATTIEASEDERLAPAKKIFDRIRERKLYQCVDYKVFQWAFYDTVRVRITAENIADAVRKLSDPEIIASTTPVKENGEIDEVPRSEDDVIDAEFVKAITADHIVVTLSKMHYGMQDKNPLSFVKFYHKKTPDICMHASFHEVSHLMPEVFGEVLLRVYTKDIRYFGLIQAGYRSLLRSMPSQPDPTTPEKPTAHAPFDSPSTPTNAATAEDAPSTPKAPFSRVSSRGYGSLGLGTGASGVDDSPFADNEFMTVSKRFPLAPASPSRSGGGGGVLALSIGKRQRAEGDSEVSGAELKKSKSK
ncbi:HD-domain/PDEase-like protein [Stereum hirsutum FP-91666 SS1]|uniref:HD-domain/PDEase-like protein n=1 Tax=Stereum hirsutum (strain FP-91666) TaxID=721885 RepID=UPI00044499DF|nr:HD-domain/PDEase-like protein [Stereum hirsutum FP-91666 SS1]EIM85360.1 HD-domain/PDEase-like protein [Stereum hirsutum FP-91666 SS1]